MTIRMCIATGVPLVESGTAGYEGQVNVHVDQKTACFDCNPRPTTKTYPICTIRHTPDKPIHCIVWAKDLLFSRLLGPKDVVSDFDERQAGDAEAEGGEGDAAGGDDGGEEAVSFFIKAEDEDPLAYARRVFKRFFGDEIEKLLAVEGMFEGREIMPASLDIDDINMPSRSMESSTSASARFGLSNPQQTWTLEQNAAIFIESVRMFFELRDDEVGSISFDKDDDLAVELVASAANLRMTNYGIKTQSLFEAKGMAGNIIHAIATTNAIISGLIVLEAKKILRGAVGDCKSTYLLRYPSNKKLIMPVSPDEPNPKCGVCKPTKARLMLEADVGCLTYGGLVNDVLKAKIGLVEPTVTMGESELIYEEDEDDDFGFSAHMGKTLREHGKVLHGSILEITDSEKGFEAQMLVHHKEGKGLVFHVHGEWTKYYGLYNPEADDAGVGGDGSGENQQKDGDDGVPEAGNAGDDDVVIDLAFTEAPISESHKRPLDAPNVDDVTSTKKVRSESAHTNPVVEV